MQPRGTEDVSPIKGEEAALANIEKRIAFVVERMDTVCSRLDSLDCRLHGPNPPSVGSGEVAPVPNAMIAALHHAIDHLDARVGLAERLTSSLERLA
jgi:hypothetical protein